MEIAGFRQCLASPTSTSMGKQCDYQAAKAFVEGLTVVNDATERCVKSITDYAIATRDSVYREDILLIGNSHRGVFQDLRRAALAGLNIN